MISAAVHLPGLSPRSMFASGTILFFSYRVRKLKTVSHNLAPDHHLGCWYFTGSGHRVTPTLAGRLRLWLAEAP